MKNYTIKYGLLGGITSITLGMINWYTIARAYGPTASQTLGYISIAIALLCVPLGTRYFRDKLNHGELTFGNAFKVGLGITFVASFLIFLHGMLFFEFAGDSFDQWNREWLTGAELKAYETRMSTTPAFALTPWFQGLMLFISTMIIGLVINLVSSFLLKTSK